MPLNNMKQILKVLQSKYMSIALLVVIGLTCKGQDAGQIIESGRLEFERRENVYFYLDNYYGTLLGDMKTYATDYKSKNPQFKSTAFILDFDKTQTFYAPKNKSELKTDFLSGFASGNTVFSALDKRWSISRKELLGITYSIEDSTRRIYWKLTDETREIAGFQCKRANGIIADSIYTVAFYTDQITTKGGPESFCGLPGMILGIALPREHITWFATKYVPEFNKDFEKTSLKGKNVSIRELDQVIIADGATKTRVTIDFIRRRALF
jgi:GLPGLI family protein